MSSFLPLIKIENVVALAYLNQPLDLESIYRVVPSVEYNPERFPGLIYRLRRPRATVLVFSSGKMVCAGADSERKAKNAINKVITELKSRGIVITSKPDIAIRERINHYLIILYILIFILLLVIFVNMHMKQAILLLGRVSIL